MREGKSLDPKNDIAFKQIFGSEKNSRKMASEDVLREEVYELICTKREGRYWDFKEQYPDKKMDLLHDIICLSNEPTHEGNRYLVIGVKEKPFETYGVKEDAQKKQTEIVDMLKNAGFVYSIPDIEVISMALDKKNIHILKIKNEPTKRPFYLAKKPKTGKLNAGSIYTRNEDTNTPIDQTASLYDTEKMWRQRFAIDENPVRRTQKYLLDFNGWEHQPEETSNIKNRKNFIAEISDVIITKFPPAEPRTIEANVYENKTIWHYRKFPEFTIEKQGCGVEGEGGEAWVHAVPNAHGYTSIPLKIKYYSTVLYATELILFDGACSYVPRPSYERFSLTKAYNRDVFSAPFHYYICGSLDFNLLQFLSERELDENSNVPSRIRNLPILIFKDTSEKDLFLDTMRREWEAPEIEPYYKTKVGAPEHEIVSNQKEIDLRSLALSKMFLDKLKKWRLGR